MNVKEILVAGCLFGASVFAVTKCTGCKPSDVPSPATIEAGVDGVNGLCTFLDGVTENQTVISVCATVEEVAWIVATFAPLLAHADAVDAGICAPIKGTGLCATPQQMGRIIQGLIAHRRARFLLDAGAQ